MARALAWHQVVVAARSTLVKVPWETWVFGSSHRTGFEISDRFALEAFVHDSCDWYRVRKWWLKTLSGDFL